MTAHTFTARDDRFHFEVSRRHAAIGGAVVHPDPLAPVVEGDVAAREDGVAVEAHALVGRGRHEDRLR